MGVFELVAIVVAVFGGGGPIAWFVHRLDKNNTEQHAASMREMQEIKGDVKEIRGSQTRHLEWHAENN